MKKFFAICSLITFLLLGFNSDALAEKPENPSFSKEEYNKLIEEGVLSSDISYEDWSSVLSDSLKRMEDDGVPVAKDPINYKEKVQSVTAAAAGYTMKPGDVFVTNGTRSYGLTGHAGIAINSTHILSIPGVGQKVHVIALSKWLQDYGDGFSDWTRVYRVGSSTAAQKAATWATLNYQGKSYAYGVSSNYLTKDPTYCSKIVWQSYFFNQSLVVQPTNAAKIIAPYDLPTYFVNSANLTRVATL